MKAICEECNMQCKVEANALYGPTTCPYGINESVWRIQPEVATQCH